MKLDLFRCAYINDETCTLQDTGGRCVWYGSNRNTNNWFNDSPEYTNPFAHCPSTHICKNHTRDDE